MAAMKAQAIAARSYAFTKAAVSQHRAVCDCALYASANDQVYAGWDKEGGVDGDRWVAAVDQTNARWSSRGTRRSRRSTCRPPAASPRTTRTSGAGARSATCAGVCDPGDFTTSNPNATWVETFTTSEVTQELGLGIGAVEGFADEVRGVSGRIISVTVRGANGQQSISGNALRSALGLHDDRVWINSNRLVTGAIRDKYDRLGCSPGLPKSAEVGVAGGRRQKFQDGVIYFSELDRRARVARRGPRPLPAAGRAGRQPRLPDVGRPDAAEREPARALRARRDHLRRLELLGRLTPPTAGTAGRAAPAAPRARPRSRGTRRRTRPRSSPPDPP